MPIAVGFCQATISSVLGRIVGESIPMHFRSVPLPITMFLCIHLTSSKAEPYVDEALTPGVYGVVSCIVAM